MELTIHLLQAGGVGDGKKRQRRHIYCIQHCKRHRRGRRRRLVGDEKAQQHRPFYRPEENHDPLTRSAIAPLVKREGRQISRHFEIRNSNTLAPVLQNSRNLPQYVRFSLPPPPSSADVIYVWSL